MEGVFNVFANQASEELGKVKKARGRGACGECLEGMQKKFREALRKREIRW